MFLNTVTIWSHHDGDDDDDYDNDAGGNHKYAWVRWWLWWNSDNGDEDDDCSSWADNDNFVESVSASGQ